MHLPASIALFGLLLLLPKPVDPLEEKLRQLGPRPSAAGDEKALADAGVKLTPAGLMRLLDRHAVPPPHGDRIKQAVERLGSDSFEMREAASKELVRMGRHALPALERAQRAVDAEVRRRARHCVLRIKREESTFMPAVRVILRKPPAGALRRILALRDKESRLECLQAAVYLIEHEKMKLPKAAGEELLKGLEHEDNDTCREAAAVLRWAKVKVPLDEVLRLTRHETAGVRAASARFFGEHTDSAKKVRPVLTRLMKDRDVEVRRQATYTLSFFGDFEWATDLLIAALKDEDAGAEHCQSVAMNAARWLVMMRHGTRKAVQGLIEATRSSNFHLRYEARRSLGNFGRENAEAASLGLPGLLRFLDSKDLDERPSAIFCIALMGPRAAPAVPKLLKALEEFGKQRGDEGHNALRTTIDAFRGIGPAAAPAIGPLVRILLDEKKSEGARYSAALALGCIGKPDKAALEALRKTAKSDLANLSRYSKEALAQLTR